MEYPSKLHECPVSVKSCILQIYIECFVTADSSARKSDVLPVVSASDRDPFAFDLGPSTFVSRTLSMPVSPPGLRRAHPRAHALGITRRSASTPNRADHAEMPQFLFAAGEDLCGFVARRRCFGPTRCWRNIYLWCLKYLWCLLFVDSRVPLGLLDQHGIAFFGPCLPARSDCCLLELG